MYYMTQNTRHKSCVYKIFGKEIMCGQSCHFALILPRHRDYFNVCCMPRIDDRAEYLPTSYFSVLYLNYGS